MEPAIGDLAHKLSSLKSPNAMLLKEFVEKRQEKGALLLLESLVSELNRSDSEVEQLKADLGKSERLRIVIEDRFKDLQCNYESEQTTSLQRKNQIQSLQADLNFFKNRFRIYKDMQSSAQNSNSRSTKYY